MEQVDFNNPETMQAMVDKWLSNANNAERGFCLMLYSALYQAKEHGNWNNLAKVYAGVNGKKGTRIRRVEGEKLPYAVAVKRVMQHCLVNIKPTFDAKLEYGVKFDKLNNHGFNEKSLDTLRELAQEGITPNSKAFKLEFPSIQPTKPEKGQDELIRAKVASIKKWAEENGIPMSVLAHAFDAKPANQEPEF